jgi:hypothetical protein
MSRLLALFTACCLALPLAGCKDQDNPTLPEAPAPCFETAGAIVAAFRTSYLDQDLAGYRDDLLAPGYKFVLHPQTVVDFALPSGVFTYADEMAVAEAMFSGQPNSLGEVLASIEVDEFRPEGQWQDVEATDEYFGDVPGARFRAYSIHIFFNIEGDQRYEVSGSQLVYVTGDFCHLLGQVDLTVDGKGIEGASWSDVKALWRQPGGKT